MAEGLSILVSRTVELGLLEAVELGRNKVKVSHLQYADDTVFVSSGEVLNVLAMKRILNNFELLSGLKVNFQKSSIMGINIERDRPERIAELIGCRLGMYLYTF